ncbi:MAG: MFS transporter, partial [Chloroflexia bacterium]|nr:MFS transporter [Chloroflexia bacterium]
MGFLRFWFKTIRLSIARIGAGWMFALLTFNFNRVSIADLGAIAVIVTSLIGLHHFISFFQVYWGRFADRYPIFGYRRTPYIFLSGMGASVIFFFLPSIAVG